jgi:LysM repeat protein
MKSFFQILFLLVVSSVASAQSSSDIRAYIDRFRQAALDQERAYGVPASITLAQGILESGAGKSGLARTANNHFGIKAFGGWTGRIYQAWDDEPQKSRFRWYNSASESFRDHSLFLKNNGRYRSLFSKSVYDYRGWAIGLQKAGYATAKNYASALIGFIDSYHLYAINGGVKLRAGKTVKITRYIKEKPVFDAECQLDEEEESEEEENVNRAVRRFVVEINNVRCTILYPGETISSIAMRYDIPKQKLLEFNELTDENDFNEGDIVFLAKKKNKYTGAQDYYRVKEGDSFYGIAQQFGLKLASLTKMNNKSFFSTLKEGEKLRLK